MIFFCYGELQLHTFQVLKHQAIVKFNSCKSAVSSQNTCRALFFLLFNSAYKEERGLQDM